MSNDPSSQRGEFARGWRAMVAGMVGVGLGMSLLINTAGLFVIPMQREFGWSRSAIAIAPMVGVIYALLLPIAGIAIDRFGARRLAIGGTLALAGGFVMLALVPTRQLPFYFLVGYLSLVATITGNIVYCRVAVSWFERHVGTAISLVLSGVSIAGALIQPILAMIIERYGWRAGYLSLAALLTLVAFPILFIWLREKPSAVRDGDQPTSAPSGTSVRDGLRDARFWLIMIAFGGAAFPIGGFVNQLQPILIAKGYPPLDAAGLVSIFLLLTAIGRLAAGALFDRMRPPVVAALFLGAAAVGAAILGLMDTSRSPAVLIAAAIGLVGLAQGAEGDFIALFTLRTFGLKHFSTLFSMIVTGSAIAFAMGGLFFSAVYDRMGNYGIALATSTAILAVAAIIALRMKVPEVGR